MRTILLTILMVLLLLVILGLIGKIIGNMPHYLDYKKDHTHRDEED